jgi:enoyl-CoA hydratase/carnithine racemase
MGTFRRLILERRDGYAILTLNRPDAANTLSRELRAEGVQALDEVRYDDGVKVLIITGAGDRHFSGGADLRDLGDSSGARRVTIPAREFITEIERLPQPAICAINGASMGGGCEIALACDLRIMALEAKIGLTEIYFGGLPGGGGTQRLPRLIGVGKAKEMIYTARRLNAEEALAVGLVNEVVPRTEVLKRAEELASEMAQFPSYALHAAKYVINEGMQMSLDQALRLEQTTVIGMGSPAERKEAIERASARSETYRRIFAGAKPS